MSLPIIESPEPVEAREISRDELLERLGDPSLVIVNALPRESWLDARIPGSLSLPVAEVRARARELLGDRGREIAVYCASPT
jgi:rhodanese-related sulfurtransferase